MSERHQAALVSLVLTALVLGPAWVHLGNFLVGDPTVDVWTHAWGLGWVAERLAHGHLPISTDMLAFPRGGSITPADPVGGVLVAPVTLLWGTPRGALAEATLQLLLAAGAGWFYARTLAGPRAGLLGAVVCATSPTFLAEYHNGILEAGWVGLVPLTGALAAVGSKYAPLAALFAGLASPYHGVSALVLGAGHTLQRREHRGTILLVLAALFGLAAGTALLHLGLGGAEPLEIKPPGIQEPTLRINAVDPRDFFWPGDHWTVSLPGGEAPNFRRTAYLGWALALAALIGWVRTPPRRWLVIPVLGAAALALGPFIWWGDGWLRTGAGDRLSLPMYAVLSALGGQLDHPLRFLGLALAALAGLAALGAGRWAPVVATVVLVENLALAPNVWPLPLVDATIPAVYHEIPADGRAIVDLPAQVQDTMRTGAYLYWQTVHRHPTPYTLKPSARVPSMNPALRTWLALSAPAAIPRGTPGWIDPAADRHAAYAELLAEGFGWVVLHHALCRDETAWEAHKSSVTALAGPGRAAGEDWLWDLR